MLTLVDPVVPAFINRITLTADMSIDSAWLKLPTPRPTLTDKCRLP
jgi:hypothetical protein